MHLYIICLVFVLFVTTNSEELNCKMYHNVGSVINGSICQKKSLCSYKSVGQSFSSEDCSITEYDKLEGRRSECPYLSFSSASTAELTNLMILPYEDTVDYSNFNIIFAHNHWKYMRYRLQLRNNATHSYCMEIQFKDTVLVNDETVLSFGVRQFGRRFKGMDAELYFSVGDNSLQLHGGGHLLVPIFNFSTSKHTNNGVVENVLNYKFLVILDITNLPSLTIFWQPAPPYLNVTRYVLTVLSAEKNGKHKWMQYRTRNIHSSECKDNMCSDTLSLGYGEYNIKAIVQIDDAKCEPGLCIFESVILPADIRLPLCLWLTFTLLPLVLLIVLLCYLIYYCYKIFEDHPVVLVLYKHTERQHCYAMGFLIEYLQNVGGVQCLQYEEPEDSSEKTQEDWCVWWKDAFEKAQVVLVVASPPCCGYFEYFKNPGAMTLGFSELERQVLLKNSNKRFLVALPPYCGDEDVPSEAKGLPHFYLPADFRMLFWHVHCPERWATDTTCLTKGFFSCLRCLNMDSAYKKHGTKLKQEWKAAEAARLLLVQENAPGTYTSSAEIPMLGSAPDWPKIDKMNLAPSSQGCSSVRTEGDEDDRTTFALNQLML